MLYGSAADAVVVVHFLFLVLVATGGLLAWRWPRLLWAHLPAVAWSLLAITVGVECPLTDLERHLRGLAGDEAYSEGFIDRYVEGVVYPERYTTLLRLLVGAAIVVGYGRLLIRVMKRRHAVVRFI